jgi:hypothetical protein
VVVTAFLLLTLLSFIGEQERSSVVVDEHRMSGDGEVLEAADEGV